MDIQVSTESGAVVVAVKGDIDMGSVPELRKVLLPEIKKKPKKVVIDFTGVGFIDSSGVAVFVEGMKEAKPASVGLVFCALNAKVKDVFELARLDKVFKIVASRKDALAT